MRMKQWALIAIIGLLSAGLVASGEYAKYDGVTTFAVTTDDGGDSTLGNITQRICKTEGWSNSIQVMLVLGNAYPATAGLGLSDSGIIQLWAGFGDSLHILAVDTSATLPNTLYYASTGDVDTLLKEYLTVKCNIYDTLGDNAVSVTYPLSYYVIMK